MYRETDDVTSALLKLVHSRKVFGFFKKVFLKSKLFNPPPSENIAKLIWFESRSGHT